MIKLETERLILRNFLISDIEDYFEYMCLDITAKYEDFEPLTYEECIDFVKRRVQFENAAAIVLKDIGKLIGDINFFQVDEDGTYEIGYDMNYQFWNKGYATEACTAVINHIFNELGGRRIYAECNDDNFSSIKLLERLGMRREGHFIEDIAFKKDENGNPIYVNSYLYAILKREWHLPQI